MAWKRRIAKRGGGEGEGNSAGNISIENVLADALLRGSPFDDLRLRSEVWRELELGPDMLILKANLQQI